MEDFYRHLRELWPSIPKHTVIQFAYIEDVRRAFWKRYRVGARRFDEMRLALRRDPVLSRYISITGGPPRFLRELKRKGHRPLVDARGKWFMYFAWRKEDAEQ